MFPNVCEIKQVVRKNGVINALCIFFIFALQGEIELIYSEFRGFQIVTTIF
jgi:hypothetical protein